MKLDYPFTEDDAREANKLWGCNCGPSALAFALQISLAESHALIPGFDAKKYVNPSMMSNAISRAGRTFTPVTNPRDKGPNEMTFSGMYSETPALVRIQWTGPWTIEGSNPKWAYRQTHWVCTWLNSPACCIFDINGGAREHIEWERVIVPMIVESIPRADGGWFPTHIWRIQ